MRQVGHEYGSSDLGSVISRYIVAIEYGGPDLAPRVNEARPEVLEHAYDLHTAQLAGRHAVTPRTAFPARVRGWATLAQAPRCPHCTASIDAAIATLVHNHLAGQRPTHRPLPATSLPNSAE